MSEIDIAPDRPLRPTAPVDTPWALSAGAVAHAFDVAVDHGLSEAEAASRRLRHGPNRLTAHRRRSAWGILLEQFKSLIMALLAAAAGVAYAFGETLEAGAVLVVIVLNTAIGFFTEWRAVRSMEALFAMGTVTTRVRRGGRIVEVPAEDIVPGEIVVLEGGDVVTADLRILTSSKLQADESALTGESVPVSKGAEATEPAAPLADRRSMLYKGTSLTRGSGHAVATATGMATELGAITKLVAETGEEATPLEKRLALLARRLIWITLVITVFVTVAGAVMGKPILLMIETGIALAVAAIPEGLPVVATIALARGLRRMARRNALVRRLSSVETLGATGIICTDKTGTLTENRMTLTRVAVATGDMDLPAAAPDALVREALTIGVLCNNASVMDISAATGDPLEVALLQAGVAVDLHREALVAEWPEVAEEAFDPDVKMMATFHAREGGFRVAVKGAPEAVLQAATHVLAADGAEPLTDERRRQWQARNEAMATAGFRVLAVARREAEQPDEAPYERLTFVGLLGLTDPPREEVRDALVACRRAGIEVVMVTGDQPVTAQRIGVAVGLVEPGAEVINGTDIPPLDRMDDALRARLLNARLFARVSPRQKLDLIELHQHAGRIVAMTGDGVNDAPALKKADIGVAMGLRGTQVAQEAAGMVLKDDAFSTIVAAIEEGRAIFENIRKFVRYLLSCNVSEVMVVGLAAMVGGTLPILPLQILFLNLVTDVFPALALGLGAGADNLMRRKPRDPAEPVLVRADWQAIAFYGVAFTLAVIGALEVAQRGLGLPEQEAVTISFLTLAFAQLWHVFNMRETGTSALRNEVTRNPYVWAALALCSGLTLAAVYIPPIAAALKVAPPGLAGWGVVLGMSLVPLVAGQARHALRARVSVHPTS
ncbi:MAG: cation-transporting P-type ATPase [Rhodothermales bacterium]|nr:cation-transporting P-type ATPase [Rhodothermales bacterium]